MFKNLFTCIKTLFQSYDKLKVIRGLSLRKILAIIPMCVCHHCTDRGQGK